MREKISAFVKFMAFMIGFALIFWGVCASYQAYFASEVVNMAKTIMYLVFAAVGAGVMFVGTLVGNLINR